MKKEVFINSGVGKGYSQFLKVKPLSAEYESRGRVEDRPFTGLWSASLKSGKGFLVEDMEKTSKIKSWKKGFETDGDLRVLSSSSGPLFGFRKKSKGGKSQLEVVPLCKEESSKEFWSWVMKYGSKKATSSVGAYIVLRQAFFNSGGVYEAWKNLHGSVRGVLMYRKRKRVFVGTKKSGKKTKKVGKGSKSNSF